MITPKEASSWGIKNISEFNQALATKSLYKSNYNDGFWGQVMKSKNVKGIFFKDWF